MYLFDLDGTLIDSNGVWADVDRTFLARRGLPYTREYREGMAHQIFPLAAAFTKEYCRLSESCEDIMAEWMALAKDSYAHVALKPYVRDVLDALAARGERMAVFTSGVPVHCETALTRHGLMPYFERVVYAFDFGVNKGSAEAFSRACALLGAAPADCTMIDDSLRACRAAKEAGLSVVGVYDPYCDETAADMASVCDRFVRDFSELLAILPVL